MSRASDHLRLGDATTRPRSLAVAGHCAPRAFTLLEVMVALAILAVSLAAIAGINSAAISMHAFSKRVTVATMLARSKMADLESKLMSEDLPADDKAEDGTFADDGFSEYRWHVEILRPKTEKVTPAELMAMAGLDLGTDKKGSSASPLAGLTDKLPGLAQGMTSSPTGTQALASAAATGGAGLLGGVMNQQIQTLIDMLGKSVREVRLTVTWGTGKTVDHFTVVTHVVSFGRGTDQVNSDPASQNALSNPNRNGSQGVTR